MSYFGAATQEPLEEWEQEEGRYISASVGQLSNRHRMILLMSVALVTAIEVSNRISINVLLPAAHISAARALARSLRESSGGLRGVQALAFELARGRVQLSMNLFRVNETTPADVIAELSRRGIELGEQQVVGLCPAAVAPPAGTGRVLEARMAAAAARGGAARCAAIADEEHAALALRLEREARHLAALGVDQDSLLSGAERSAALNRVLKAAQVVNSELEAMLDIAAHGLFSALDEVTRATFPERVAALDRVL